MCGINGVFAYRDRAPAVDRDELLRTRDYMERRGPDGAGVWLASDDRVGFGHRRLSIIDLSETGAQPMVSSDGRLVVTFNGEIYNHRELRRDLERRGRVFRSQSDTEVLLHLYAERGADMVHALRGMFAFAIWDDRQKALFAARDPYGIKPFYYADDGRTFRFASQVKALLAGGGVSSDPHPAAQVGFFLWGSVPEPFTMYSDMRVLSAGSTLLVDCAGVRGPVGYHSISRVYCEAETVSRDRRAPSAEESGHVLREALLDSVRDHLVSDVPVGAFLSGGVDSGALVGLMRDAGQQEIRTVTLAFEEYRGTASDESPAAERLARAYETTHATRVVTANEFAADLPCILSAMDQPTVDGINTWFVSKAARELGLKVAVSGLGGDELLGGYASFLELPRWVRTFSGPSRLPGLGRLLRVVGQPLAAWLGANPKVAGMLELGGTYAGAYQLRRGLFMPWELSHVLDREVVESGIQMLAAEHDVTRALTPCPQSPFAKVATLESSLYMRNQLLRDTDWSSMGHSLEVRVPMVDATLLADLAPFGVAGCWGSGKAALAATPRQPLPADVTNRPKTGFSIPVETWLPRDSRNDRRTRSAPSRNWAREVAEATGLVSTVRASRAARKPYNAMARLQMPTAKQDAADLTELA